MLCQSCRQVEHLVEVEQAWLGLKATIFQRRYQRFTGHDKGLLLFDRVLLRVVHVRDVNPAYIN
jgi:hypothetical protein